MCVWLDTQCDKPSIRHFRSIGVLHLTMFEIHVSPGWLAPPFPKSIKESNLLHLFQKQMKMQSYSVASDLRGIRATIDWQHSIILHQA